MTIKSMLIAVPVALASWLTTLMLVAYLKDGAPAFIVLFPNTAFMQTLPEDVSILSSNRFSITLSSDQKALTKTLYSKGALIVLPAGLSGCSGSNRNANVRAATAKQGV